MRIAWLCYKSIDGEIEESCEILFYEPRRGAFDRVVQIVYHEVESHE